VSTVGVVSRHGVGSRPRICPHAGVSLHAATDAERDGLVPLNRRYRSAEVLDAAADFAARRADG